MNLKQRNCFRPKKEKKNKTKAISVILVESSDSFSFIPKIIGVDFYLRIAAENNSNYNNKRILGIPAQESRWMKQMNLAFHFLGHYTTIIIIDTTQISNYRVNKKLELKKNNEIYGAKSLKKKRKKKKNCQ